MAKNIFRLAGVATVLLFTVGLAAADTATIAMLARMTMNLNHFVSDEDQTTLKTIIDSEDSSDEEAAIAMALANFRHQVAADDAARLVEIVDNEESDESVRTIADILLGIMHAASPEEKATLAEIAGD